MSRLELWIDGVRYEEWTHGEVTRDLKDFAGTFEFSLRDGTRSISAFPYASPLQLLTVEPGQKVTIKADGQTVLAGYIESVDGEVDDRAAQCTISGKDKAGDLIDCACAPKGPGEYKSVKLEDAAKKIAQPFGLSVRTEIDTGKPFPRYALDLGETALSAIEKGARQRHALVTSDGVGGVVITRTGANKAPADLMLPGNVLRTSWSQTHKGRHSRTIVRGQAEKAEHRRRDSAARLAGDDPDDVAGREDGDGSATERERKGTAMTGSADDPEIDRYRPIVHLARSQPDSQSVGDEADWRMRTARAQADQMTYTVHGFSAGGRVWRVNEMTHLADAYRMIERDVLISCLTMRSDPEGNVTELTLTSPEAFDNRAVGKRRSNQRNPKKAAGSLDSTANPL